MIRNRAAFVWITVLVIVVSPVAMGDGDEVAPVALRGLDPVHLIGGEEVQGDPELEETHRGYRYRFATVESREKFRQDPERFRIQNETCVVYPGATLDPSLFVVHQGKIWAFATEGCVEEFEADPETFLGEPGQHAHRGSRSVALVVYEGVELLDFAGPGEVFAAAGHDGTFEVSTVGPSREPVMSQGFVRITPTYAFADAPAPDVVVVPGGGVGALLRSPQAMAWLERAAAEAEVVLSVCNGALVLARAGLLDGLEATTHHGSLESLRRMAPRTRVHDDRRFVDNGRIVTAAGVSAGIDAALHVVDRLLGADRARRTARYMEYSWSPDAGSEASDRRAGDVGAR